MSKTYDITGKTASHKGYTSQQINEHIADYLDNGGTIKYVNDDNEITHELGAYPLVKRGTTELVSPGDVVNGYRVVYYAAPHKPSSSGKVSVVAANDTDSHFSRELFAHVIGCEFINRPDRLRW